MPRFIRPAVIGLVLTTALLLTGCRDSYRFTGGEIKPAQAAAPLNLTDQDGNAFTLDQWDGKVALIYFGYTTCPDLCPTTLSDFTAVKEELGEKAQNVRFSLVSVDPERDTPNRLKEYLGFFDPDFIGLTGTPEQVDEVKRGYGVVALKVEQPESATGYLVDHTSLIYVIDRDGKLRLTFPYGADPADIAEDVRHLL
jgi:protein SCO1/2